MSRALLAAAGLAVGMAAGAVRAGGSPENVLIIINPANAESMYLGHYYQNARNIPASNVLYIDPAAVNYPAMAASNGNIDAVFGKLANGRLPGRVRTGVPTQARVQHAGTDRDPEARGRVPAIEGQDGKSKDAIFFLPRRRKERQGRQKIFPC